nr:hypothetical protein [Rhodothermus marinus]
MRQPIAAARAARLEAEWRSNPRWAGIRRPYTAEEVLRLRGSVEIAYTLTDRGARRLWELLHTEPYVAALGALTGNQAMQQVKAGLKAIYVSGWQVAADANLAGQMYPDQSLYPSNSVPASCAASTTRCCAPTRFTMPKATTRSTGSCPSWPTPRPASAVRSMPSS